MNPRTPRLKLSNNIKRPPLGRDPRLCAKVLQTTIFFSKYNMPKDYNYYHCSFVWSYNNKNVYFRLFSLCV